MPFAIVVALIVCNNIDKTDGGNVGGGEYTARTHIKPNLVL